jgi:hypothetical protein
MYVYPKAGVRTRDPVKKDLLPESGREVPNGDPYWLRRIADGDVKVGKPAPAKAKPQKTSGSEDA